MADQNSSTTRKENIGSAPVAEGKGKGKAAAEPAQESGMDVDDSSSEEEVDEVSSPSAIFIVEENS
jgi:hypothetical protein